MSEPTPSLTRQFASNGGWYLCGECGIHRRVPEGASTICEINGAGSRMEPISELVAITLSQGDKRIVELEAELGRRRTAYSRVCNALAHVINRVSTERRDDEHKAIFNAGHHALEWSRKELNGEVGPDA